MTPVLCKGDDVRGDKNRANLLFIHWLFTTRYGLLDLQIYFGEYLMPYLLRKLADFKAFILMCIWSHLNPDWLSQISGALVVRWLVSVFQLRQRCVSTS